jgi:predicted negative regulator of RcsB-dependent stress response
MEQNRYGMMTQNSAAQANAAAQQGNMAANQIQSALAQQQGAYTGMNQQLAAMQLAQGNASMAQTGQLTGAGYAAQLGMGGIEAQINANVAANNLYGDMFGAGMSAIGGIGDNGGNWWSSLWGDD